MGKNISVIVHEALDWTPEQASTSLHTLGTRARNYANSVSKWYLDEKSSKGVPARVLRLSAIIMAASAGIVPMVQQAGSVDQSLHIQPVWASILAAGAIFFHSVDKFFGFSSAWIRYITAEVQIKRLCLDFDLDWEALVASLSAPPTQDQIQKGMALVKQFLSQVHSVQTDETRKWAEEFQDALKQAGDKFQAVREEAATGALTVIVKDGEQLDGGWTLSLDHLAPTTYQGRTAAFASLTPGSHVIRIDGLRNAKPVHAEGIVQVKRSESAVSELTPV